MIYTRNLDLVKAMDSMDYLRAVKAHHKTLRIFAVWCAKQVEHLMSDLENGSRNVLNVAERHANGLASDEELSAAFDASPYAPWNNVSISGWAYGRASWANPAATTASWAASHTGHPDAVEAAVGAAGWAALSMAVEAEALAVEAARAKQREHLNMLLSDEMPV